jgi:hypothetical protein
MKCRFPKKEGTGGVQDSVRIEVRTGQAENR